MWRVLTVSAPPSRPTAVEPCPQGGLALRGRMLAIGFEIAIEPPDQRARSALSLALFIREGVELVNEALGMDPAQAMRADVELPGVIADDDGVGQEAIDLTLPHKAPSVATMTGSGLTSRAEMPRRSR